MIPSRAGFSFPDGILVGLGGPHGTSLRFLKSSVKVVRHMVRLWKVVEKSLLPRAAQPPLVYKSSGLSPVCLAMRASIFGPISTLS
jgi:hypothetical protein